MSIFWGLMPVQGTADVILVDSRQRIAEENVQLDDPCAGHGILFRFLSDFLGDSPAPLVYAGIESTGGSENTWSHSLQRLQHVLPVPVARFNPVGVRQSDKAEMHRNVPDKMRAKNVARSLINHRQKVAGETEEFFGG